MPTIDPELLLQSIAQALDTMAFIAVEPLDQELPEDLTQVTLTFNGPVAGHLAIRAPITLGAIIAANLAAIDPASTDAINRAADALGELTNITAGLLLRRICSPEQMPDFAVPTIGLASSGAPGRCVASFLAEGQPVCIGMTLDQ